MIAQVLKQDAQKLVLYVKGKRKSWRFTLQITGGIFVALFVLFKLIGISWLVTVLISIGATLPFFVILYTLFRRVFEPDRYFIFDKAWNIFQCKIGHLEDEGKTIAQMTLSSLQKIEGIYDSTSNQEKLLLEFTTNEVENTQIVLYNAPGKESTRSDQEHLKLFLKS